MPWLSVEDYSAAGWANPNSAPESARVYCSELEKGEILFFSQPPFEFASDDRSFLVSLAPSDSRLHKNISYRPEQDILRGFDDGANQHRVHQIVRDYAIKVQNLVSDFLAPYSGKFQMDYTSFRPLEEEGRNLPLHKRNDLLHVDAFPSRPTRGGRILRIFTNINPTKSRIWIVGQRFPDLASEFADAAGLARVVSGGSVMRQLRKGLNRLGLPVPDRSRYDEFMLHFHDWLKENSDFQSSKQGKERLEFPPFSTWLVYTDGVPHAALSGQFAMEQTLIIPVNALVSPAVAPIRVLEQRTGKRLS